MSSTNHNILFKATVLALCVISFVHIFLFPLYDLNSTTGGRRGGPTKTYADFEQTLCTGNLARHRSSSSRSSRSTSARCPQYGIVTSVQGGRLGNQMWEYASVWALARRTGLEPYVPRCIRLQLNQVFAGLSVPTLEEIAHCSLTLSGGRFAAARSLDAWNSTNQSIVLPRYSVQPELVITWVQDVVQEFAFRRSLLRESQEVLRRAAAGTRTDDIVFVGVHVRRTDYIGYLMRKHAIPPAGVSFFRSAMQIFQSKYPNVVFVVVSDDPIWCHKVFAGLSNVHVASRERRHSAGLDLAILASCNHTIFDYGTFGEWGAILAGGETIYYNLTHHSSERLGQLLENWRTI